VLENIQLEVTLADSEDLRRGSTVMYHNKMITQLVPTTIGTIYNIMLLLKTWPRVWTCGRGVPKAEDEKKYLLRSDTERCYNVIHCDRMINAHIIYIYIYL